MGQEKLKQYEYWKIYNLVIPQLNAHVKDMILTFWPEIKNIPKVPTFDK